MALENVFDHAITDLELKELFGSVISRAEYESMPIDADSENGNIFRLYMTRGDEAKAQTYLDKIKDEAYKFNVGSIDTV